MYSQVVTPGYLIVISAAAARQLEYHTDARGRVVLCQETLDARLHAVRLPAQPGHRARAWGDTEGGNLRTARTWLGVEWVYPVGRDAIARAGLAIETAVDGRACRTRPTSTRSG